MSELQQQMVAQMHALAPEEGYNLTALPDVRLLRSNRPLTRTPVLYDPGIVIVCQGCKRGFFAERIYQYDAQHYLAVSVPVPFSMETDATPDAPLLAIYLHLDFQCATDLMLQLDQHPQATPVEAAQSLYASPMSDAMQRTVVRFLEVLSQPLEAAILGPALVRELYFHVLTGEQGGSMRAALMLSGKFGQIGRVLRQIHARYAESLTLNQLAAEAGMSVPTFHTHFKGITSQSPMQYVKSVRLHQARMLMVRQQMTAAAACHAVGYESPSQFTREFKRLFGLPPGEEIRRMQQHFAVPPAHAASAFISSH